MLCQLKTREIEDNGERGVWGECVSLLWTCFGRGVAVCGQRQCAFVLDPSWPHWQTNLWLGGVSVSVLSVGATERNSRGEEKRASKNREGVKEKKLAWKKSLWDTLRLTKKTVATSVLLATEVSLWHAVASDGGKYSNADRPKREALSCLQYSGLHLTWKGAMRAISLLGIQRMSAR